MRSVSYGYKLCEIDFIAEILLGASFVNLVLFGQITR